MTGPPIRCATPWNPDSLPLSSWSSVPGDRRTPPGLGHLHLQGADPFPLQGAPWAGAGRGGLTGWLGGKRGSSEAETWKKESIHVGTSAPQVLERELQTQMPTEAWLEASKRQGHMLALEQ